MLGCGCKGTDLDSTGRGRRAARGPIKRRIKRGEFHDYESPQLLLGVSEGAILYAPLSFLKPHCRSRLRHLKRIASEVGAGFDERLMVRAPSTGVWVGSVAVPRRKRFR